MTVDNKDLRLLPYLIDHLAEVDPTRAFFSVPKTRNPDEGFQDVPIKAFANAVNRCARHIEASIGRAEDFPTVAYMGPQDIVYAIVVFACAKTGHVPFLSSPRNSLAAHLDLFEKTNCNTFLLPPAFPLPTIKEVLAARQMRVVDIPYLPHWLVGNEDVEPYPFTKTFEQAVTEPFIIFHTSGSTGLPKPIVHTHKIATSVGACEKLTEIGQNKMFPDVGVTRLYSSFPLFHVAGFLMTVLTPLYMGYTAVVGPFPPTGAVANSSIVHGKANAAGFPPTVLMDLARTPEYLENLKGLKFVVFGGGPLPREVGERIRAYTDVYSIIGTTECGVMPFRSVDLEDWEYMSMSPAMEHEFREASDGLYELIIVRTPEAEKYQTVFSVFPDLKEFSIGDLYEKHPTKENLWKYRGRADDVLVYSTGEKFNPVDMEGFITTSPLVQGALVAGQGRFQSSLLIEPAEHPADEAAREAMIDQIWPLVKQANARAPTHARILRDKVIFTPPEKPMPRAGKGTVQRRAAVALYEPELDALYGSKAESGAKAANGSGANGNGASKAVNGSGQGSAADIIRDVLASCTDIKLADITPNTDLFEVGLDSLQISTMAKKLSNILEQRGVKAPVEPQAIYAYHTVAMLTSAFESLLQGNGAELSGASGPERVKALFESFTEDLPITTRPKKAKPEGLVFLLTGSTGSLGSYILDSLVKDPRVAKIYCLNRGPDSVKRQETALSTRDLNPSLDKVEFLEGDLAKPYLGLWRAVYKKLLNEVTNVVHNAWKVNFNQRVDSFSTNIQSVRRFIDFSAHSTYGAKIYFISSISTVSGKKGDVPETVSYDWEDAQPMGYGQSKLVAETMLDAAAKEAGVPAVVCRVGQIGGPTTRAGSWPKQEWLPSLVASSKHLGKLPSTLGPLDIVDWVPVDVLGRAVVELSSSSDGEAAGEAGAAVHQTVNRSTVQWKELAPGVQKQLGDDVKLVSLDEWVVALRESAAASDLEKNPAVKLLGFFEGLSQADRGPVLDMSRTCKVSKTLAGLGAVSDEWMANWIRQWGF